MGWGPDAPDMSGSNAAAQEGAQISREQWEWAKARQPKIDAQTDEMIRIGKEQYGLNRDNQIFQQGLARKYDDRYWGKVAPMQDRMLEEAANFDTDGRREELASQAAGDVNQAFGISRRQNDRALSRMGINPNDGRTAAVGSGAVVDQASAIANAMNKTRQAARAEGYGRKVDANAMMSGMSGFSSTAAGLSGGFGSSALTAGAYGLNGLNSGATGYNNGAGSAAGGLQAASGSLRANTLGSANNSGFDGVMGLASGALKNYGIYQMGSSAAAGLGSAAASSGGVESAALLLA